MASPPEDGRVRRNEHRTSRPRAPRVASLLAAAILLPACEELLADPQVGAELPGGGGPAASFSSLAVNVLAPHCATSACHGGSPPAYAPRLDAEAAWGELVGRPSFQVSMNLVEPGSPEQSYLVLKLRGAAGWAGGIPTPMPTDYALDEADIAAIEAWIANGAPND
jgi:hypothetical protein